MKSFEQWEREEVQMTFGIKLVKVLPSLNDWLAANEPISDFEQANLTFHLNRLKRKAEVWNEDEIKFFFVSTIVSLVDFFMKMFIQLLRKGLSAQKSKIFNKTRLLYGGVLSFLLQWVNKNHANLFSFYTNTSPFIKQRQVTRKGNY